jgi:hypothetical protein
MTGLIRLPRRTALLLPWAVAACGGDAPSRAMPPLRYDYLPSLRLNVAAVDVGDAPPPGPVEAQSPAPTGATLRQMALDRLAAGGSSGRAVFIIDAAQVDRNSGNLNGLMAVHLDILTADGARAGFAEARVSRSSTTGSDLRGALYDMTRQMMDDMNIELEFEIRRSLRDWLQDPTAAPPPPPVEQQDLPAP